MKTIRLDNDAVNCIFTTDWHLTDQPPGRRTKSYREEILAKVKFAIELANRLNGVSLFGGDMYHHKNAKNLLANSHALQTRLEETLRLATHGTIFGTHGNHDLWADRVESIPTQPIGSMIASGALTDLSTGSVIFENNDGSVRVQVDAYPFTSDDMLALSRVMNAPPRDPGVQYRIVLMHQYGDPGDAPSLFGHPTIGFNRMAECDYDFALWGHDHSRTETVTVGNCTHIRLGSLARAALSKDETDRPIAAAILSFSAEKVKYKEHVVPAKPLTIAFTQAGVVVEKVRASDEVTKFFTAMEDVVAEVESSDPREVLSALCPANERNIFDIAVQECGL